MLRQLLKILILVFVTCQLCAEVKGDLVDGLKGIFSGFNRKKGNGVTNRVRRVIDDFMLLNAFINIFFLLYFLSFLPAKNKDKVNFWIIILGTSKKGGSHHSS